jgi:malate dehydrogenase (decarboxylating)
MFNIPVEFAIYFMACSLSKAWFVHSNSSLEFSAGIGVLSMAKQEMLRMLGKTGEGEGNNQFWVLDKDVS